MTGPIKPIKSVKIPMDIRFIEDDSNQLTVSMTGEPTAIVHALVNGLPLDALEQLNSAFDAEVGKRRERAEGQS